MNKTFPFSKYHGNGNDFLVFDNRKELFPKEKKFISHLCHRNIGIGADGVLLLETSTKANYRMRIFNSDGSEASSCGNGLSCIGLFIKEHEEDKELFSVETQAGIVEINAKEKGLSLLFPHPKIILEKKTLVLEGQRLLFSLVDSGVPHVVIFVDDIKKVPVSTLGKVIRSHSLFEPEGTNVNFASILDDHIHLRTFERGVEEETLSCGTGALAVATIAKREKKIDAMPILLHFPYGTIEVTEKKEGLLMRNFPKFVFSGVVSCDGE